MKNKNFFTYLLFLGGMMDFWYGIAVNAIRLYTSLFIRKIHVLGRERILEGPKIIIGNHSNATDAFILPLLFREKLHFFAQSELFTLPLIGKFLTLADQIPVYIDHGLESLKIAKERLNQGDSVVIFPEGRLNHSEKFHRARLGAALLAYETGAPVLPVGIFVPPQFIRIIQTRLFNRDSVGGWQFGGPLFINIGESFYLDSVFNVDVNTRYLRQVSEQMMDRVKFLVQDCIQEAGKLGFLPLSPESKEITKQDEG